ncbi:MAG: type II toxin-antitoxin system RelB/DinJ family antitoxin [Treponema sp.]
MAKTTNINVRVDPETKANAEQLFSSFGITINDAINIFLHKSLMEGGLPFEMKQTRFNLETEMAIEEARLIMSGKIPAKYYTSTKELFDELEIDAK